MTHDRKTPSVRNVEQHNSLLDQYSLLLDSVVQVSDQEPSVDISIDNSVDDSPRADLGCFRLLLSNDEQRQQSTTPNGDINTTISEEGSPDFQEDGEKPNEMAIQSCEDNDESQGGADETGSRCIDVIMEKQEREDDLHLQLGVNDAALENLSVDVVMEKQEREESDNVTEDDLHLQLGVNDTALESLSVDIVREQTPPHPPKPSQLLPRYVPSETLTSQTLSKLSTSFHGIAQATSRRVSILAEQALSHAAALAHPYTATVGGCATESALFVADRARLLADRYIRAIASDDPEVRHMQRMVMAREAVWGWMYQQSCFLATLPWHLRRLLRETRDLDEAIEEALVASETEAKAKYQQQRTADSRQESGANTSEGETATNLSPPPSSSSPSSSSSMQNEQCTGRVIPGTLLYGDGRGYDLPHHATTATTNNTTSSSNNNNSSNNSSGGSNSNNNSSVSSSNSNCNMPAEVPVQAADVGVAGFHHWLLGRASAGDEEAQYAGSVAYHGAISPLFPPCFLLLYPHFSI